MAPLTLAATAFFALPVVSAVAVPDVEISPGVKMPMIASWPFLYSDVPWYNLPYWLVLFRDTGRQRYLLVICCILPFLTSDISGLWHLQAFLDYLLRRGGSGPVATTWWPTHRHSSWLWYWAWCRRSSQEIRCKQLFAYDMILFCCQKMFLTCFGMLLVVLQVFIDASYHWLYWFVKDIAFQYTVNCF